MNPLKILFVTAEATPFAKAGGLADVSSALPRALAALGHDVRVVMPLYARAREAAPDLAPTAGIPPIVLDAGRARYQCTVLDARFPDSTAAPSAVIGDGQAYAVNLYDPTLELTYPLGPSGLENARDLVVYMRRSGSDPQLSPWVMYRNHLHPAVHRVQDAIAKNPAEDWSSEKLADVACMSPRNLSRLFAEHAGCSPLDYVQRLRVALAREMVMNSDLALERVAERSGFSSAHQLRRVWRRWESAPPAAYRATRLIASQEL